MLNGSKIGDGLFELMAFVGVPDRGGDALFGATDTQCAQLKAVYIQER